MKNVQRTETRLFLCACVSVSQELCNCTAVYSVQSLFTFILDLWYDVHIFKRNHPLWLESHKTKGFSSVFKWLFKIHPSSNLTTVPLNTKSLNFFRAQFSSTFLLVPLLVFDLQQGFTILMSWFLITLISKEFWQLCTKLRITGFLDYVHGWKKKSRKPLIMNTNFKCWSIFYLYIHRCLVFLRESSIT
jgi:hypothetical protein